MDIELIENTISELEQDATTYENCNKLASLYICRMFNKNANMSLLDTSESVSHDNDILQSYYNYIEAKRQYQQYEVAEPNLLYNMQILCDDLIELISTLYHNTEIEGERALIVKMINDLRGAI